MALTFMFAPLALLLIIGVPVAVSLARASLIHILIEGRPAVVMIHTMINGVDSFPLLAIPFFISAWMPVQVCQARTSDRGWSIRADGF